MGFKTNKARRAYWQKINTQQDAAEIEKALNTLPADTAHVIRLHFQQGHSLNEIAHLIHRSISIVRNHHNRGIYKLSQYFGSDGEL